MYNFYVWKWLITILKTCEHSSSKRSKTHIGIKHSTSICSLCKCLPFPILVILSLADTACSNPETTRYGCVLIFCLFGFPSTITQQQLLRSIEALDSSSSHWRFLHTTRDVSVGFKLTMPSKAVVVGNYGKYIYTVLPKKRFLIHASTYTQWIILHKKGGCTLRFSKPFK